MKRAWTALLLASVALGCGGPRWPKELTFEGARLGKATSWSRGKISGVAFIPPGEKMETASIQVGLIVSREHASGAALHAWVMEQYHSAPIQTWHEAATADEACKVGLPPGPPRPFVALHVCRAGKARAACAEADQRLDDGMMARCLSLGFGCWDELCNQKWNQRRATLEVLVKQALEEY